LVTQELNKLIKKNKINMTEHLTLETFKEKVLNYEINTEEWVYEGKIPCIIDFYASWCGPCKMIAPILEELSEEYKDKIIIYKIDTEKEQDLAAMFGIRSIPSILFVPMDGKPSMINGALPKKDFEKVIKDILLKEEE
jgi:thioredoxin